MGAVNDIQQFVNAFHLRRCLPFIEMTDCIWQMCVLFQ